MNWEAEALGAEPRAMPPFRRNLSFGEAVFAGKPAVSVSPMHALIALQRADGSWELSNALARAIGRELGPLETVLSGMAGDPTVVRAAWATTLALAWLELHAADSKDEWRLLADKARKWLAGVMEARAAGRSFVQLARRFVN